MKTAHNLRRQSLNPLEDRCKMTIKVTFINNKSLYEVMFDDTKVLMKKVWLICMAENPEFNSLPCFLFGESMGGAVALKTHLKQPKAWNGAILCAPMCKVHFLKHSHG